MKHSTLETQSSRRIRGTSLWAAFLLLLALTSWAAMATAAEQGSLVLDPMPDFLPYTPANWADSIIPGPGSFSDSILPLPVSLWGDATTYFGVAFANLGDAQGSGYFYNELNIDHNLIVRNDTPVAPSTYYSNYNVISPVSGGRHTLWQTNDTENNVAEHDETNNDYARQWVWEPQGLLPNTQELRAHPPVRSAGTNHLPDGVTVLSNRDGMRMLPASGASYWRGAAISSPDPDHDYDIALYEISTGVDNGFGFDSLASSAVGGWNTDAVISNKNNVSDGPYDVGILNWNGSESDYSIEYRESGDLMTVGEVFVGTMAENQMLQLAEFQITSGQTGLITLELECITDQDVMLGVFDPDFTEGSIYDTAYNGLQGPDGRVFIELNAPAPGYYGVVFYRNAFEGTSPFTYRLKIWAPSADLAMVLPSGSHAPLVPRNNLDIDPGDPVPAPEILDGDVHHTALYYHMANLGSISPLPFNFAFSSDGVTLIDFQWPLEILPADPSQIHSQYAYYFTFQGGRHTAGIMLDSQHTNMEIFENNNYYAEQWVWNPTQLTPEATIVRETPPVSNGGWDLVAPGVTLHPNVDGLRSQTFTSGPGGDDGYWGAVALLPIESADLDLRLYNPTTGPGNGFDTSLEMSAYGGSNSEFILLDFDEALTWNQAYDAGALQFSGESAYTLQSTRSLFINEAGLALPSAFAGFGIAVDEVISLTEFTTNNFEDEVSFILNIVHESGDANYGVKVFQRNDDTGFYRKLESIAVNESGGPGVNKTLELTLPGSSYFGLVVYKLDHTDYSKSLQYEVQFLNMGISSTPEEEGLPSVTKIEGVYPNPFNPQTTIRLAMKESGPASVKIYDVQGRLVRTLVEGSLEAGRHELRWTGVDNSGRSVPSGVYFVRAVHTGGVDQQRMSLVK